MNETDPFLSVRIFQIVDSSRVPVLAQSKEFAGPESVLGHDDEVNEESGGRLHHTDLTVSHGNQPECSRNELLALTLQPFFLN